MSKCYRRGKFNNRLKTVYNWPSTVVPAALKNFAKTLIIRGIGYRAFALKNDLLSFVTSPNENFINSTRPLFSDIALYEAQELSQVGNFEFSNSKYLAVRAGHTKDLYLPLRHQISCLTLKKDRKLVIASIDKIAAANLANSIYLYRPPSVYTGRGVRVKHVNIVRKAGKKDKQKGRAF